MNTGTFLPPPNATRKELDETRICNPIELPFEQLAHQWLAQGQGDSKLTLIAIPKDGGIKVAVCHSSSRGSGGIFEFSLDEAKTIYGQWPEMPEKVYNFCDKPGITPDAEWFETRNKKLKIVWDDKWDSYVLPARSLAPLALSYITSTRGMLIIERGCVEYDGYKIRDVYHVKCVFMAGENDDYAWEENYIILEQRLEKFLSSKNLAGRIKRNTFSPA